MQSTWQRHRLANASQDVTRTWRTATSGQPGVPQPTPFFPNVVMVPSRSPHPRRWAESPHPGTLASPHPSPCPLSTLVQRRKGRSGVGLTPGKVTGAVKPARQSREELGAYTPLHPACLLPAQPPPSFLSLSALFPSPSLAGSPALIKCSVSGESARLPPPAPAARSPQTKLLSAAPPGSCHLNPCQLWGVRGPRPPPFRFPGAGGGGRQALGGQRQGEGWGIPARRTWPPRACPAWGKLSTKSPRCS